MLWIVQQERYSSSRLGDLTTIFQRTVSSRQPSGLKVRKEGYIMTSVQATHDSYEDIDYRRRVEYFMVKAAIAVTMEKTETTNHTERLEFAKKILTFPQRYVTSFAIAVLTDPTLLAAPTTEKIVDEDLEVSLNNVWDCFLET